MSSSRQTPLSIEQEEFKRVGHELVDRIAAFLDKVESRPVTTGETPGELMPVLGSGPLPEAGKPAGELLARATELLFDHSLLNGHPKFFGYITSSPTPIGALADLLAAAVNPNVGANILSPMATQIERQTIQWLAELIGVPSNYGGILVSGGNMANFTGFLAAKTAKASPNVKQEGLHQQHQPLLVYCSRSTHTWIEKAMAVFGLGTNALRWVDADSANRIRLNMLEEMIEADLKQGAKPFLVVGTAGDVSTGAVDDLKGLGAICKKYDLWFHVDGAYGIPAAAVPALKFLFDGIEEADSIALDPHKWLYAPLEAGCTLVKDPNHLIQTFSSHPVYYNFSDEAEPMTLNFYEYGLQNSRGFRALKVWLALQQAGRDGYADMIATDVALSKLLYDLAQHHPELEALTQNLSITTLRYVPAPYEPLGPDRETYLNKLNEQLLNELQKGGKVFLSNAVVDGKYCLRSCIVNFRTAEKDIRETIDIIVAAGQALHARMQQMVS